jgi:HSP20 family protein
MANEVSKKSNKSPVPNFPNDPFAAFREEMNSMLDRAFSRPFSLFDTPSLGNFGAGRITPQIDIHETEKEFTLTAELPGMDEKDVEILIDNGMMTLKGEKKYEKESDKDNARVVERRYGSFQRSFTLPSSVDEEKISASFDKGVLKVKMPKGKETKPSGRRVEIGKS